MFTDKIKIGLAVLSLSAILALTGCSSSSDSSSGDSSSTTTEESAVTPDFTTSDEVDYSGSATISGTVDTSSVAEARSAGVQPVLLSRASASEKVKLYVVDEGGAQLDTGKECTISGSDYSCPNVKDDQDYIVRYVKDLGGGKVLEMKSTASIAANATAPIAPIKIDPVSTYIAETIIAAVEEAITGVTESVSATIVADIIKSVKAAVVTAVQTLVSSGAIEIPSPVVELEEGVDFDTFAGDSTAKNGNMEEATGTVLTNGTVDTYLQAAKAEAKASALDNMSKRDIIKAIFSQMSGGDGGGPAQWMVNFMGDIYDSFPETTVGELQTAIMADMSTETGDLQKFLSETEASTLADTILSTVKTNISNGTALSEAKTAILRYHELKAKVAAGTELTLSETEEIKNFPTIVGKLFPKTFTESLTTDTQFENLGQAIVYTVFLVDIYAGEATRTALENSLTAGSYFDDQIRNVYVVNFEGEKLFTEILGMTEDTLKKYAGISFDGWVEMRTDKYWDSTNDEEKEVFQIYLGITNSAWMLEEPNPSDVTAKLTYPNTAGTTTTVDMDVSAEDGHGEYLLVKLSPWTCTDDSGMDCSIDTTKIIDDHVSGEYKVAVTYKGETTTKTFSKVFVLKNGNQYKPKLTSPKPYPQWPSELELVDDWANMSTEQQTIWNNYQTEEQAFWDAGGISTFDPAQDGGSDSNALEGAVFKWKEANITAIKSSLPEGVIPAYQVGIQLYDADANEDGTVSDQERQECDMNRDDCQTEIYNTWWNNRAIRGTELVLPVDLPANTGGSEYNIYVQLVFIDKETGRQVAQGGDSYANFKVGQSDAITGDENVTISGTVSGTITVGTTKVALIAEKNYYDSGSEEWVWDVDTNVTVDVASDGTYTIDMNVSDIKTIMDEGRHINLVVFNDTDDDDQWDPWNPSTNSGEDSWWPENAWFWFETWGEFRVSYEVNGNYDSKKVVKGQNIDITGFNIKQVDYQ